MKLSKCIEVYASFEQLATLDLPIKASFQISKNLNALREIIVPFDQTREGLVQKFKAKATTDDSGNMSYTDEQQQDFKSQIDELLDTDQDVSLCIVDLTDCKDLSVQPRQLVGCQDFIDVSNAS